MQVQPRLTARAVASPQPARRSLRLAVDYFLMASICGAAERACVCVVAVRDLAAYSAIEMCGHRTAYALPVRRGVEPHLWHDAILKEIAILRCPDPKNFLASQGRTVTDHELASVTCQLHGLPSQKAK